MARLWSVSAMGAPWERASLLVCVLILDRSGCGAVTVLVGVTTHWWEGLGPEVPLLCLSTGDETGTYGESQPTSRQRWAWGLWLQGPGPRAAAELPVWVVSVGFLIIRCNSGVSVRGGELSGACSSIFPILSLFFF